MTTRASAQYEYDEEGGLTESGVAGEASESTTSVSTRNRRDFLVVLFSVDLFGEGGRDLGSTGSAGTKEASESAELRLFFPPRMSATHDSAEWERCAAGVFCSSTAVSEGCASERGRELPEESCWARRSGSAGLLSYALSRGTHGAMLPSGPAARMF